MAEYCQKCGANLDLVGRTHRCRDPFAATALAAPLREQPAAVLTGDTAVNAVNKDGPKKPVAVNRGRGAYPGTEKRREYMREYMRKKRTFGKGKI